jgi:flagellar biosynthesis protein FliQ
VTQEIVIRVAREGLLLVLLLSAPPVVLSLAVGLAVSLLQAATQIQEQTLSFVPKLLVVYGALAVAGSWKMAQLVRYTASILTNFSSLAG